MTATPRALMVYCTCPDTDSASRLAEAAVNASLAACVSQLDGVTSVFKWAGELAREKEILLIAKTTPAAVPALTALWQEQHPYELPEIVAVPIEYGSEPYLAWIESALAT